MLLGGTAGVASVNVAQLICVRLSEFAGERSEANQKGATLGGRHRSEHSVMGGAPGLPEPRGGILAGVSQAEPQIPSVARVALAGDEVSLLESRAEAADPAFVHTEAVRHLLLGESPNGVQLDQQGALSGGQSGSRNVADGRLEMHGDLPHHPGEQQFELLGF